MNYFIENVLEQSGSVVVGLLMFLIFQVILFASFFMFISAESKNDKTEYLYSFGKGVWDSWTFLTDAGTQANEESLSRKLVAGLNSFIGIVYFAIMQALLVDMIREKMDGIKKGKGFVVEDNHLLILGWSSKALILINELATHNICDKIVVLSEMDKAILEQTLEEFYEDREVAFESGIG